MASLQSLDAVRKIINHVFLPPQLPQSEDETDEVLFAIIALEALRVLQSQGWGHTIATNRVIFLLETFTEIHSEKHAEVSEDALRNSLLNLRDGDTIIVKVTAQNAAVLIGRETDKLVLEGFELWADNESVMKTRGRLLRTFPTIAVAIDFKLLDESDLAQMIANTLTTLSCQKVAGMQPQTRKTGVSHDEDRNATRPVMVLEFFFAVLRGLGSTYPTTSISKRIREEILWADARSPWRRSSTWALLRVGIHLTISRAVDADETTYKKVMLFIMSSILEAAQRLELPSDILFVMNAKLNRRRQKLLAEWSPRDVCDKFIGTVIQSTIDLISKRWQQIQKLDVPSIEVAALAEMNLEKDTEISLPKLDICIKSYGTKIVMDNVSASQLFSGPQKAQGNQIPTLPSGIQDPYGPANLQTFERWVAQHLDSWCCEREADASCQILYDALITYHSLASELYSNNPEGISVMILTVLELWVAMDREATKKCALLAERKTREDMFEARSSRNFASRYYDNSTACQALKEQIVKKAETARELKLKELDLVLADYKLWNDRHNQATCLFDEEVAYRGGKPVGTKQVHNKHCKRCYYRRRRDRLSIEVCEWPLPRNDITAKTVIFELRVPTWFARWRDARLFIFQSVLGARRTAFKPRATYRLDKNDPHLTKEYFVGSTSRVTLFSEVKPLVNTHFSKKSLASCSASTICGQQRP
ncbi:hypothetical protein MRB53_040483 [Persea americana]|nr:hypothetical protein MRB53_040483 [Persea americana]